MKRLINFLISLFALMFLLTTCTTNKLDLSKSTEETLQLTSDIIAIPTIPIAAQGKGVVCGFLLDKKTNLPPQASLFLSKNIAAGREDVPAMMSFSYQTNPRAEMNEAGYFCFEDVEPGVYALTLWTPPGNTQFIENADGQDYLWIVVESGSVIDLGHLSN
ncbi:MAG TPA: hypothetical protein PLO13_02705 [Anaerolineaceae bacterium]|jgi:hypothetical protein|nr:hypothetical protein [Anaerolineaceae bacterium]